MRYCLTCGNLLGDGRYCGACGAPVGAEGPESAGSTADATTIRQVPASGPLPPPDPAPRTKGAPSRRTLMIAGGGVALVVGLAAVVTVVRLGGSGSDAVPLDPATSRSVNVPEAAVVTVTASASPAAASGAGADPGPSASASFDYYLTPGSAASVYHRDAYVVVMTQGDSVRFYSSAPGASPLCFVGSGSNGSYIGSAKYPSQQDPRLYPPVRSKLGITRDASGATFVVTPMEASQSGSRSWTMQSASLAPAARRVLNDAVSTCNPDDPTTIRSVDVPTSTP